jgi:integrase
MPKELNFTKRSLEALKAAEQRITYHDIETPGLSLLLQPTGHRSFFWFRRVNGNPLWLTIGEFPALSVEKARVKAGGFNSLLADWKSEGYEGPSPFKQRNGLTFGELFDEYHEYRRTQAKNPDRSQREEKSQFDRYLKPWANRKLDSLRRDEFRDLHSEISKKIPDAKKKRSKGGRVTANRTIQLGRRMVYWAIKKEKWHGENPFKFELHKEKSRDRFAQTDELQRLFKALASETNRDVRDFIRLALFTGQRRGDVTAMRWSDLSLTANGQHQWTISNPKNGETHIVPLLPEAVAVLGVREKRRGESQFVFPSRAKSGHIRDIKRGWKRLKKAAKLSNLTVHDLRRTLGSWMAMSGVSLPIIGEALGHKSFRSTEVYARLQTSAARDAMTLAVGKFPKLLSA